MPIAKPPEVALLQCQWDAVADKTAESEGVAAEVVVEEEGHLHCRTMVPLLQTMLAGVAGELLPLGCMAREEVLAVLLVVHAIVESGPERASTCPLTGPEGGPGPLRGGAPQCVAVEAVPLAAGAAAEAVAATHDAVAASVGAGAALTAAADAALAGPGASAGPAVRAQAAAADAASAQVATAPWGHATASALDLSRAPRTAILGAAALVAA